MPHLGVISVLKKNKFAIISPPQVTLSLEKENGTISVKVFTGFTINKSEN